MVMKVPKQAPLLRCPPCSSQSILFLPRFLWGPKRAGGLRTRATLLQQHGTRKQTEANAHQRRQRRTMAGPNTSVTHISQTRGGVFTAAKLSVKARVTRLAPVLLVWCRAAKSRAAFPSRGQRHGLRPAGSSLQLPRGHKEPTQRSLPGARSDHTRSARSGRFLLALLLGVTSSWPNRGS